MKSGHSVTVSSDYATCQAGRFTFYYGYEQTVCADHGANSDCDCAVWAFVVTTKEDGELVRWAYDDIGRMRHNPAEILLRGISRFGNEHWGGKC